MNRDPLDPRGLSETARLAKIDRVIANQFADLDERMGYVTDFAAWMKTQTTPIKWSTDANAAVKLLEAQGDFIEACFYDEDDKDWTFSFLGGPGVSRPTFAEVACVAVLQEWGIKIQEG